MNDIVKNYMVEVKSWHEAHKSDPRLKDKSAYLLQIGSNPRIASSNQPFLRNNPSG